MARPEHENAQARSVEEKRMLVNPDSDGYPKESRRGAVCFFSLLAVTTRV
jgi:hypothetical protein